MPERRRASQGITGHLHVVAENYRALMTGKFVSSCPETVHTLAWAVDEQMSHFLKINIYSLQTCLKHEGTSMQWIWQRFFYVLKILSLRFSD